MWPVRMASRGSPGATGRPGQVPPERNRSIPAPGARRHELHRRQRTWMLAAAAALVLVAGVVAAMIMTSHHKA